MLALEWADVDLVNRQVCVRRSDWNGHVTTPKGGRLRHVLLTRRLAAARRAGLPFDGSRGDVGGVHILRHSFCSHLAMRDAPARAIQELVGHRDLSMTQRYMHLRPAALDAAIRLLEEPVGRSQTLRGLPGAGDWREAGIHS